MMCPLCKKFLTNIPQRNKYYCMRCSIEVTHGELFHAQFDGRKPRVLVCAPPNEVTERQAIQEEDTKSTAAIVATGRAQEEDELMDWYDTWYRQPHKSTTKKKEKEVDVRHRLLLSRRAANSILRDQGEVDG